MRRRRPKNPYSYSLNDPDAPDTSGLEAEAKEKLIDELSDDQYGDALIEAHDLRTRLSGAIRNAVTCGPDDWQHAIDRLKEAHEAVIDLCITDDKIVACAEKLFHDACDEAAEND